MNYNEMLLNLTKMADAIKIPNVMNADEISLDKAREQKTAVVKEISRIRKLMLADNVKITRCKDCAAWDKQQSHNTNVCTLHNMVTNNTDYCSYGRQRSEEDI